MAKASIVAARTMQAQEAQADTIRQMQETLEVQSQQIAELVKVIGTLTELVNSRLPQLPQPAVTPVKPADAAAKKGK